MKNTALASIVQSLNPAAQPVQAPPPPPEQAPGGFLDNSTPKPKRGGLPLDIVANIQNMYKQAKTQPNLKPSSPAQPAQLGLDQGWGGKGR